MPKQRNAFKKRLILSLFVLFSWVVVIGAILTLIAFLYFARQIPPPETIITRKVSASTKIYDRTGNILLYDVFGQERRTIIELEKIPLITRNAVISTEDTQFYSHGGLDIKGILRAALKNLETGSISQGGSTITQQLVKTSLLGFERTFSRKIKEVILSLEIERKFTKDQILWMYLNQIPFGSNLYGIEAAAENYFKKSASDLTVKESAILASMIKAPSYYYPFGSHQDELIKRSNQVVEKMLENKFISKDEYDVAVKEEVKFSGPDKGILAPHFVLMIRDQLIQKYGDEVIQNGGLKITTSLDWDLQEKAEEIVLKYGERNEKLYKAKNAALVALDPKTGQILALVGSRDYFNIENEGNFNVATALRQPGSSFKPVAYSVAIEKGVPDSTQLFDVKTEFNPSCPPSANQEKDRFGLDCYHPQNYDSSYRGPVSMRRALGNSLNVPSVKVLYLAGIPDVIEQAKKMGITSLSDPTRFGLSLVLGGAEVSLLELTGAYGVFANEGLFTKPIGVLRIEDQQGEIIENNEPQLERVLSENTARAISNILSDNQARSQIFGLRSPMFFPNHQVAAKTGTTQDNRDAWILGYTPSFVAGVWVGNNDNSSMTREGAGISAAGPMWHDFMLKALEKFPKENFTDPEPNFTEKTMLSGKIQDSIFGIHSILFFVDRNNPLGPPPDNPTVDPQYNNWEWSVQEWISGINSPLD